MNTWGNKIKLSIFGESHGPAIGIVMDGLPAGVPLDLDLIRSEMLRRAPGKSKTATSRNESDEVQILSGFFEGTTTGTPLCATIVNTDTRSEDYHQTVLRPGHADLSIIAKHQGFADYRGGGHSSGRLTAMLVFAGAVAKQILAQQDIEVRANIQEIGGVKDSEQFEKTILDAKENHDSVGGIIECIVNNVPPGIGDPFFYSIESSLSLLLFSVPSVKGVEFGDGFKLASMRGSQANDAFYLDDSENQVKTKTNHNGGINGGISNGMPLVFRVVIKPTPSIGIEQETVDVESMTNVKASIHGRHDPCIVPRAVPVIEACAALCLLDYLL